MNILIVDDDDGARDSLEKFLQSEGHDCRTAQSGLEALEFLEDYSPGLIIADIQMPTMDGIELAKHIQSDFPGNNFMIILTTGEYKSSYEKAKAYGVHKIIKKPIRPMELRRCVPL